VFLISEAFKALDERLWRGWDWRSTTVLYVSYDWDPASGGGPEALAGRRLIARLLESGARVHVLTAVGPDTELRSANYDATVIPSPLLTGRKAPTKFQLLRSGIPEGPGLWVRNAVRAGIRVTASLPADTIIYSRAMPASSNVVAWHLAQQSGLCWVAHFSDDWPPVQNLSNGRTWLGSYKWPLFQLWRQRILRDSDALTFTNPDQAAAVLGRQRERYLAKTFVVTHLPSTPGRGHRPPQHDIFHIVHTGNFYSLGQHTSAAIMQGLRLFLDRTPTAQSRVRFTQAGWADGDLGEWTSRCGLHDVVRVVGRLTERQVVELLDAASLLVAVDYTRRNSRTLLSKLPDYVTAARPILAVTAPSSAMGRLFHEQKMGLTAHYDSPEQVATCLTTVFHAWEQHGLDAFLPRQEAIESFTWERVVGELAGAFATARRRHEAFRKASPHRLELRGKTTTP
jgi:hypothetical protein